MNFEFVTWGMLGTYTGALMMVLLITQLTKDLPGLRRLPTQIWSYLVALAVLFPAHFFTGNLNGSDAVLILFNSVVIALAANGGFEALSKAFPTVIRRSE